MKPIWIVILVFVAGFVIVAIIMSLKSSTAGDVGTKTDPDYATKQSLILQIIKNHPLNDIGDGQQLLTKTVAQLKAMVPSSVH